LPNPSTGGKSHVPGMKSFRDSRDSSPDLASTDAPRSFQIVNRNRPYILLRGSTAVATRINTSDPRCGQRRLTQHRVTMRNSDARELASNVCRFGLGTFTFSRERVELQIW
jgi:hypothetical protein